MDLIQKTKSALLVIDVQQEMFEKNTPVYSAEQMLANINALAEKARATGAAVVFIQHDAEKQLVKARLAGRCTPR